MTVLGLHDGHNASACVVRDGMVLAALAEERLTNVKNQAGVPRLAIKEVLEIAKVDPAEIDLVAVSSLLRIGDPLAPRSWPLRVLERIPFGVPYVGVMKYFRQISDLRQLLVDAEVKAPLKFVEHHTAHAALAYYQRPWEGKTLILTLDGAGDGVSATVSIGQGQSIHRIASTSYYDSLSNNLYSEVTSYLGMKRWEHEYKLMGLAPYGKPDFLLIRLNSLIRLNPLNPLQFENLSGRYARAMQPLLAKIFAGQRFDNIAAATQKHFEGLVVEWVRQAIKRTRVRRLACAGGSFLNVKANQLIRQMPEVKEVFFHPACDDVGTSVGAALAVCQKHVPLDNLYWGIQYPDVKIKSAIRPRDIAKTVAKLLAAGKIIARFSGRDEFGPRALGNRSILADPRDPHTIRKINFAIKMRDFWMPFAPAILEEDAPNYLRNYRRSPFMIESFNTTNKAKEIIAGLHPFDLSCRPQTVNRQQNPDFYQVIKEFKKLTGVGAVLNTSFNLHGFPIVGTPETAVSTFLNSGLDALALGCYLLQK